MNNNTPSANRALRTLLIMLAIVIGIVIYAYGWQATDISLEEVQDETRQASVSRALRELFSPDIFTRDRERKSLFVDFAIGCPEDSGATEQPTSDDEPYVIFTPPCADVDEIVRAEGFNFPADGIAALRLIRESGQNLPFKLADASTESDEVSEESVFDIDGSGRFEIRVKVPRARGLSGNVHQVEVQTVSPTGWPRFSDTTEIVIEKMIETIFLALMATTLAIPISVVLSFLAARNLMKQVRLPLGNVLVGFVLLPIGGIIGYLLLGPIGRLAVDWGEDLFLGIVSPIMLVAAFTVMSRVTNQLELNGFAQRTRSVLMNALLILVIIFVLGALGGIAIWIGEHLEEGILKHLGEFVGTLGTLVDLTITFFAAVGVAFWTAAVGSGLSAKPLRTVVEPMSNILGAVLGFAAGAILLYATGLVGTRAVLLGLISPIVAAVLGGQTLVMIYQRLFSAPKLKRDESRTDQAVNSALFLIGAIAIFLLTAYVLDMLRAIVDERPPSDYEWDLGLFSMKAYLVKASLIGGILGAIAGGLAGTQVSFPLGMTVYNTARTILNALRSIEPLIMGIVFVIWVGVGPFAGVLALTLHSIASLGKLYSEQVENIDAGPIEAIQATGANRIQTIIYGVVPQIVPPYIAFTMYRWDINVRMSTIIGFVGGGGIGFLLQQQINLLRYNQAGVAVLAIAIVVSILDYASAAIRERIV